MTSPYLDRPVRTPREAATDLRLRSQYHPELAEWADRLDMYADDVEARARRDAKGVLVGTALAHMTLCCATSTAFLCSGESPITKLVAVTVATCLSYDGCRSLLWSCR